MFMCEKVDSHEEVANLKLGYFSSTSSSQSTVCSLLWADIYLGLISISFCNVRISSSRVELSKS